MEVSGKPGEAHDELDAAARHRQYAREWAGAMVRYCQARQDTGPIASWTRHATNEAEARAEAWLTAAGINIDGLPNRKQTATEPPTPSSTGTC